MDFGRIYFGSDENDELISFSNVNYVEYIIIPKEQEKTNVKRQKEDIKMQKYIFQKVSKKIDYLNFTKKWQKEDFNNCLFNYLFN